MRTKYKILYIGTFRGIWVSDYYRLDGFRTIFDSKIIDYRSYDDFNFIKIFRDVANEFIPDIIFINKGESIPVGVIADYKYYNKDVFIVVFNGDQRGVVQDYLVKYDFADMLLINNNCEHQWKEYRALGLKNICEYHSATDVNTFTRHELAKLKYDIVFIGGYYKNRFPLSEFRKECIVKLHEFGYKIAVAGSKSIGSMAKKYGIEYCGQKYGVEFADFVSSSKVVLSISAFSKISHYTSNRTFNSIATGACLCHSYEGCNDIFVDGKEIVYFNDINDIKEKMEFLVEGENYKSIYNNSMKLASEKHTYGVRAKQLLDMYNKFIYDRKGSGI